MSDEFRARVRQLLISEDFADDYADEIAGKVVDRLPSELVVGETVDNPHPGLAAWSIRMRAVELVTEVCAKNIEPTLLTTDAESIVAAAKIVADFIATG